MVIEEQYPHAVTGIFSNEQLAQKGIETLRKETALEAKQIQLLQPGDRHLSRKLEPESGKIYRTLLSAHLWSAVSGLLVGIALAWLMIGVGPSLTANNPVFTVISFAWVGTLVGAMIGGLITLRPDRERLRMAARESSREGDWTVVAHCRSVEEKVAAESQLEISSRATSSSL